MRSVSGKMFVVCVLAAALAAGGHFAEAGKKDATLNYEYVVAQGNNSFAADLYKKLAGNDGNLFLSPFSIRTALSMTYAGARGETAEQFARTLHVTLGPATGMRTPPGNRKLSLLPPEKFHEAMAGWGALMADIEELVQPPAEPLPALPADRFSDAAFEEFLKGLWEDKETGDGETAPTAVGP